ncbi:MAG: hypothetical protein ACFCVC_12935 [Acidimicrobiia bacterium]
MRAATLLLVVGLTACSFADFNPATTEQASTTTTVTTAPTTAAPLEPEPAVAVGPCADESAPFTETGTIGSGGAARSDAAVIDSFDWVIHEDCERLRMSFSTPEGAPAVATPIVGAELIRHVGVVRVEFASGITEAAVVDHVIDTPLIDRVSVFSSVAGTLVADIHLAAPAFARILTEDSPAALVIDLVAGGPAYATRALRQPDMVVLGPDPAFAGYPITISGYADSSSFESLTGTLEAADGSVVVGTSAVAENPGGWGGFAMVFPDGPSGELTITLEDGPTLELTVP